MISRQMATAIAVMAVSGESSLKTNAPLLPSLLLNNSCCRSLILKIPESVPTTVRRFPPVDALLHSPEKSNVLTTDRFRFPFYLPNSGSQWQQCSLSVSVSLSTSVLSVNLLAWQHGTHWLFKRSRCNGATQALHEYCPGPKHEWHDSWQILQVCVVVS